MAEVEAEEVDTAARAVGARLDVREGDEALAHARVRRLRGLLDEGDEPVPDGERECRGVQRREAAEEVVERRALDEQAHAERRDHRVVQLAAHELPELRRPRRGEVLHTPQHGVGEAGRARLVESEAQHAKRRGVERGPHGEREREGEAEHAARGTRGEPAACDERT